MSARRTSARLIFWTVAEGAAWMLVAFLFLSGPFLTWHAVVVGSSATALAFGWIAGRRHLRASVRLGFQHAHANDTRPVLITPWRGARAGRWPRMKDPR